MKKFIIFMTAFGWNASSFATGSVLCHYTYGGAPFADVSLNFDSTGTPLSPAVINEFSKTHTETVTPVALGDGESVHLWLSKESPDNAIELIIYKIAQAQGNSVLINPQMPAGIRDIWGQCQSTQISVIY